MKTSEIRLIDANALLKILQHQQKYGSATDSRGRAKAIVQLILSPTIDAEPVRHGRWINNTFCSECNRYPVDVSVSISNQELTRYFSRCPHCGAKMQREEDPKNED